MKKPMLLGIFLLLSLSVNIVIATDWFEDWEYRKSHNLIGSTTGPVTDYQIRITAHYGNGTDSGENIYLNGKCRTDFGDIRFTASDGSTLLNYWIEKKVDSDYAIFWVKIPGIPASPDTAIIYVYYGNPSVTTTSNGTNTFLSFQDWEAYNNGDTLPIGEFEVGAILGTVKVDDADSYEGSKSLYHLDDNSVANERNWVIWNFPDKTSGGYRFFIIFKQKNTAATDEIGWHLRNSVGNQVLSLIAANGILQDYYGGAWHTITSYSFSKWHVIEICVEIGASTWDLRFDDTWYSNRTLRTSNPTSFVEIYQFSAGTSAVFNGWTDPYFISKYVDPEPTHGAWGSEESYTVPAEYTLSFSNAFLLAIVISIMVILIVRKEL